MTDSLHRQSGSSVRPRHLTGAEVKKVREMRADGHTCRETAEAIGRSVGAVQKIAPGRPGKVPNARLRTAFLESALTAHDVAKRIGWWCKPGKADDSRLKRTLGINEDVSGKGQRTRRSLIDWETGAQIAEALGYEPWELLDDEQEQAA